MCLVYVSNCHVNSSDLKDDPDAIAAVLQSPSAGSQRMAEVTAAITTTPSKVRAYNGSCFVRESNASSTRCAKVTRLVSLFGKSFLFFLLPTAGVGLEAPVSIPANERVGISRRSIDRPCYQLVRSVTGVGASQESPRRHSRPGLLQRNGTSL